MKRSRTLRATVQALACALLLTPFVSAASSQDRRPERAYDADVVAAIQAMEARTASKLPSFDRTAPDTSGFDVVKYTIRYDVNFPGRTISADVTVDATSTVAGLSEVTLDFVGFSIGSVRFNGAPVAFSRVMGGRGLRITPSAPIAEGAPFTIDVSYSGAPPVEGVLGFGFYSRGAATFAEPEGARLWFPCKDRPSDKAMYEGFIEVPSSYVVASNGRLVDTSSSNGRTTYHWSESHQIATYLINLSIAEYRIIEDSYGDLPIVHYVYPELYTAARQDFSRTPEMMQVFEERLGVDYPFDKYAHALFQTFNGAMEHQSCTSYSSGLITGDNRFDRVVAHELGHHWFGDLVSPIEWEEIWLNEGFATWTEFLWTEHYDPGFLPALMEGRENTFINYENQVGRYSLYGPPREYLFGTTIYQKGGWVVAMLRYMVGDEAFFAGLNAYLTEHADGNASTQDLRNALEVASGQDLSAFFDEWVYSAGYPQYQVSWTDRPVPGGRFQVDLRIKQTQAASTTFTTPLEVEAVASDGRRVRQRIDILERNTIASLCLDFDPVSVRVDPDNRVLGPVTPLNESVPNQPALCAEAPDEIVITNVELKGSKKLRVTGTGFIVGDAVVEVDGLQLEKTKYPKKFRNSDGTTSTIDGKQKRLKDLIPPGTAVQVTVVNLSTGIRSAPFQFQR